MAMPWLWFLTMDDRFDPRSVRVEICGGLRSDDEIDISQSNSSIFHSQHNSTNAP